ncbi:MAG: hypothetical protein L3J39_01425 [Verrucomicrobiales bacterium]|nr:hypothetical protein [Verrucomicrobiales bacterium]
MTTLNQSLHQTSHQSPLMRKVKALGFANVEDLIQLAIKRGCHHFKNVLPPRLDSVEGIQEPGLEKLSQDELVILLLHGNNRNEPIAIRCAAQLLKSKLISPRRIAFLAIQERCETPLKYIAQYGAHHDLADLDFWNIILNSLAGRGSRPPEAILPHPSRFMINPGLQRGTIQKPFWLTPQETRA